MVQTSVVSKIRLVVDLVGTPEVISEFPVAGGGVARCYRLVIPLAAQSKMIFDAVDSGRRLSGHEVEFSFAVNGQSVFGVLKKDGSFEFSLVQGAK